MSNSVMICNHELGVKVYNGQPVITFKDIDRVHERPDGTARKRFRDNRKRFEEGRHYYKITPSEFRTAIGDMDSRQQNDVILMTERGYLLLVKSFTDDLAWQIQDALVEHYFNHREDPKPENRVVKTYSGVPVVSLSDIDKFHELSPGTAALYFFNVFDRFTVNDDFYFVDASDYNAAFGCNAPVGKPVALLNQRTYELLMFPYIPLVQIKAMIPEYFCISDPKIVDCTQYATAPKPSVTVEQPVDAIEQKPVENLTSELIIPNRGVRDRIDLTFSAYAATYNYYRSGKRIKTKNLHKVDGYGYLEGIGANILSHASHYGCAGYGPLTMRPDEDPHFCFPISSIRKDGKITIPKLGLFELKTPLWIEEGSRPVTATVRRTKDNKYMVEIRRKSN